MNDTLTLGLECLAGGVFGAIFFGGLWWTVRKGVSSKRPALWFSGSLLVRTGIVLAGFYFAAGHDWERMLACLFGFVTARLTVIWLSPPPGERPIGAAPEANHAS